MQRFSCGDVVPGCGKKFEGATADDVLAAVAAHAREVHHIDHVDSDNAAFETLAQRFLGPIVRAVEPLRT